MHRPTLVAALGASLAAAALGCADGTAPAPRPRVAFLLRAPDTPVTTHDPPAVAAEAGVGGVAIRGTFLTPCADRTVTADAALRGDSLAVTVRYQVRASICARMTIALGYDLLVTGLPGGAYRLVVTHVGDVQPSAGPVLATAVTVRDR